MPPNSSGKWPIHSANDSVLSVLQEPEISVIQVVIQHQCAPTYVGCSLIGTTLWASANEAGVCVDMTAWSDADAVQPDGLALVTHAGAYSRRLATCLCCITPDSNCTWYEMGPLYSMTVLGLHCDLSRRLSQIINMSPTGWHIDDLLQAANSQNWVCTPWLCFCLACSTLTFLPKLGCNRPNWVQMECPKNNKAGDCPVVAWGVLQDDIRKLCHWCCKDNPLHSPTFMACLKVWTNLRWMMDGKE